MKLNLKTHDEYKPYKMFSNKDAKYYKQIISIN